ncbi:DUF4349 domain-containing protein [Aeromicrobium sp. P5_D10]
MSTPTLHDERIQAMRAGVMLAVDHDISRRGRRARRTVGIAAASVVVIGFGAIGVRALDVTSTTSADSGGSSAEIQSDMPSSAGDAGDESSSGSDVGALRSDEKADADRQVITTGSISVTVTQPRQSAAKLSAYVESLGGRVDNRNENGTGDTTGASLQVRVPATKVSAMIERLKTYGTVDDVSLQNEDVTTVSRDLDARIGALKISVERLEAILAKATTSREVISAEGALTKRQEQLESLQSQKRSLAGQVELSTVSVDFNQKASVDSVEPGGFTGGLRDGWNGLVSTVNNVVELVGILLPWLAIAALLAGLARLIARRKHWN